MVRLLFYIFLVLMIAGCAREIKLIPAPGGHKSSELQGAANAENSGVQVLVESDVWSGNPEILQKIIPLRVTIQNKSGRLLLIRYSEFKISGKETGRNYAALPPYEIRGTIQEPLIVLPYPFPINSLIEGDKFSVAPYCARMYPTLPAYQDSFSIDSLYYNRYYTVWAKIQLPTEEVLRKVLPDGVIDDGGHVSGFLYFETIHRREIELSFAMKLVDAANGQIFGTITIPYLLDKK